VKNNDKPREKSNPTLVSEPGLRSNPLPGSEPFVGSNPSRNSEPYAESNPELDSEPTSWSNPSPSSEPSGGSHPSRSSEPSCKSNPQRSSEPLLASNPSELSEPCRVSDRGRVRQLVEIFYDVQDVRIRSFNRLRQVGEVKGVNPNILKKLEREMKTYILSWVKQQPIYAKFLCRIRGIGPILSAGIISWLDPAKADHPSSFWKFCGLHVEGGRAVKREKGKKLGFSVEMRTFAWKIADSFVKKRTPVYRRIYDEAKVRESEKLGHPEKDPENCPMYAECMKRLEEKARRTGKEATEKPPCKLHIDYRARRKMVKRFLADLWARWREIEGLPVTEPYAIGILGHDRDDTTTKEEAEDQ
jgi:hypothetical protein